MKKKIKYNRRYILKSINQGMKMSKKHFFFLIAASILLVPVSFISPFLFGILIDKVMKLRQIGLLKWVGIGLMGVYFLRFVLDGIDLYCGNVLLNRFTYILRKRVWKNYLNMDYNKMSEKDAGDLKMRFFDDINSVGNFHKDQIVDYTVNILMIVFALGLTVYINWKLALICLIVIPLVIIANKAIGKGFRNVNEDTRKVTDEYYTFTYESLQYWKEIKAMNAEENFIECFSKYRQVLAELGYKWIKFFFFQEVFKDFKENYLTKILVYISGAFFVISKSITIGELVIFSGYFELLLNNIDGLNGKNVQLRINQPYYERILEIINETKSEAKYIRKKDCRLTGKILVSNVDFQYNSDDIILKNINLNITPGEFLEVSGESGCGKTTFIKLILNLYKPQNGMILYEVEWDNEINMMSPNDISYKDFYRQIGVVMQDGILFDMSIKENLLLANNEATDLELMEACERSNIGDFIRQLPDGFNTVIGEKGVRLSGGQKQRLKIAQVFLQKPPIIIFDEATSSVDGEAEEVILNSIRELKDNTTFIMITHKTNLLINAQKSIIIKKEKSYE